MSRAARALLAVTSSLAVAAVTTACGTEKIKVSRSAGDVYHGAVLFNQRCSGCHTLSYAATHGSAANVRTAEFNNGPNFNVRCERPVTRVLYAIENGGFSGAIMPQNIVVGRDATDVAQFVAKYAGRQAPKVPGAIVCSQEPIGLIPPPLATTAGTTPTAASGTTGASGATGKSGTTGAAGAKKPKSKSHGKPKKKP